MNALNNYIMLEAVDTSVEASENSLDGLEEDTCIFCLFLSIKYQLFDSPLFTLQDNTHIQQF